MSKTDQLGVIKELAQALLGEVESLTGKPDATQDESESQGDFYELIREYEILLIRRALLRSRGNQAMAARMLRLKPSTLHHKIRLYDINPDPKSLTREAALADARRAEARTSQRATP
jgi:DNA-binding NtrC family response regulator